MKTKILISLIIIGFLTSAFSAVNGIIEKLNLQHQYAQEQILNNFIGSFRHDPIDVSIIDQGNAIYQEMKGFRIPRVNRENISSAKKETALELCEYVKEYVSSKEFAAEYEKARKAAEPNSEPYRMDAASIADMQNNVKDMEANYKKMKAQNMPAAALSQMEAGIAQMKKNIADNQDPTPNKTKWNKMYPADVKTMIENRLNEYLALSKTVDFGAELKTVGRDQKFVNPEYEAKSLKWKAIYRAGKDTNDAVTVFVQNWLKEGVKVNVANMKVAEKSSKNIANSEESSSSESSKVDKKLDKIENDVKGDLKNEAEEVKDIVEDEVIEKPKKKLFDKVKNKVRSVF